MDIENIKSLSKQSKKMEKTFTNLGEAFQALCKITEEIVGELNKLQRKLDDQEEYRMEQNERI